jgi:hypothetical protein
MNCVPVTVSVNAAPPTVPLEGDIDVIVGVGLGGVATVKVNCADVPPPGDGFTTVISAMPEEAISEAAIEVAN